MVISKYIWLKTDTTKNQFLIRLNDRDKFIQTFREEHPPPDLSEPPENKEDNENAPKAEPA